MNELQSWSLLVPVLCSAASAALLGEAVIRRIRKRWVRRLFLNRSYSLVLVLYRVHLFFIVCHSAANPPPALEMVPSPDAHEALNSGLMLAEIYESLHGKLPSPPTVAPLTLYARPVRHWAVTIIWSLIFTVSLLVYKILLFLFRCISWQHVQWIRASFHFVSVLSTFLFLFIFLFSKPIIITVV